MQYLDKDHVLIWIFCDVTQPLLTQTIINQQNIRCSRRFQEGAVSSYDKKTALIKMLTHWCDTRVSIQKCCCPRTSPKVPWYVQKLSRKPWACTITDKPHLLWIAESHSQQAMAFRFLSTVTTKHLHNTASHTSLSTLILSTTCMFPTVALSCV